MGGRGRGYGCTVTDVRCSGVLAVPDLAKLKKSKK